MRKTSLAFGFLVLAIISMAQAETIPNEGVFSETQINDEVMQLLNAAELGNSDAMYELGDKYYFGEVVDEDPNLAAEWYSKAMKSYTKDAEAGDSEAMFRLGIMHEWGEGVAEDISTALDWYRKASVAGNNKASYELGELYYFGESVEQDYVVALGWFQKAAEAGNSDAMYKIGLMYENGKGVDKDYEQAKGWYKDAIDLGDNDAKVRVIVIFLKKYYKVFLWTFLTVLVAAGFVYGYEKRALVEDTTTFEITNKPKDWTLAMNARRYIGALLIYIFYKPMLVGAMSYTFARDSKGEGWGDHYILSMIAILIATFCAAFLVGATAKKKGGFVASLANIPSVLFSITFLYFLHTNISIVKSTVGWSVSTVLATIGSVGLAYWGGTMGEKTQNLEFDVNTILGIRPFHWSWLWFMGFIYLVCMFYAVMRWLIINNITELDLISAIPVLLALIPVLAYGYPMLIMYDILCGKRFAEKHAMIKVLIFVGIYIGGLILGTGADLICSKIISVLPWSY